MTVTNGTYTWYPLVTNANEGQKKYDVKNSLEFVYLPLNEIKSNATYTVIVNARTISRTQSYSIVIAGEVSEYIYHNSGTNINSGLSKTARILIILTCVITFCFSGLVVWIAYLRPTRRKRIEFAMKMLQTMKDAVDLPDGILPHLNGSDDDDNGSGDGAEEIHHHHHNKNNNNEKENENENDNQMAVTFKNDDNEVELT